MANYTGANCPVCDKRFTDEDDIVVCPICGAPHHRACYQQLNHCALEEMHIKGHSWQPSGKEESETKPEEALVCPSCGAENPPNGIFCQVCGAPMNTVPGGAPAYRQQPAFGGSAQKTGAPAQSAFAAAFGGLSPSEEIEGVTARDIAIYVGENSSYFLNRFHQLAHGGGFTLNFSALFFNFFYFFYRKMYAVGTVLLAIIAVSQIPMLFIMPEAVQFAIDHMGEILAGFGVFHLFDPQQNLWAYNMLYYVRFALLAVGIVFACFANRFYMRHVLKKIRRLRDRFHAVPEGFDDHLYTEALAHNGRTNRLAVVLISIGCVVVYFGVYMVMMLAMMPK